MFDSVTQQQQYLIETITQQDVPFTEPAPTMKSWTAHSDNNGLWQKPIFYSYAFINLTVDTITISWLAYQDLWWNKIIFEAHKRSSSLVKISSSYDIYFRYAIS